MMQAAIPFITAIALSAIAGFYSVIGLAQIFPGSFWPIILMGTVLEIAKLVTVSWLYNNWNVTVRAMRYYFVTAIIFLMLITSMGIFGFLSRAHIESSIVVGSNSVQLDTLNSQEKIAKERLTYLLKKAGDDPERISRATDRAIQETQAELKRISDEKLPLLKRENELLAEVGPIKYIAELLYTKEDPDFIDKAVRAVIIVIIFVFDPLAILLLIAANQSYKKITVVTKRKKKRLDRQTQNDVSLNDSEIVPKSKIANMNGGSF